MEADRYDDEAMPLSRWIVLFVVMSARVASAQSPELSMREFASGQIKKGVRSIGFGGDGATWGNYGLVYRAHDTAVLDVGATGYTNGNIFQFTAVGLTTPDLWHGLAIYVLGLAQTGTNIHLALADPALGAGHFDAKGDGGDELVALRIAMPLGRGFSLGIQLTYEQSHFDAILTDQGSTIRYRTRFLPSGGLGIAWTSPHNRLLIGTRVIFNNDWEERFDAVGDKQGLYRNYEYRLGISGSPWRGAYLDAGGTLLERQNAVNDTHTIVGGANLGIEQSLFNRHVVIRGGVDECQFGLAAGACTPTAGLTFAGGPVSLDLAYLYNLGQARVGTLFGTTSHSVLATLNFDYGWFLRRRHPESEVTVPPHISRVPVDRAEPTPPPRPPNKLGVDD